MGGNCKPHTKMRCGIWTALFIFLIFITGLRTIDSQVCRFKDIFCFFCYRNTIKIEINEVKLKMQFTLKPI